MFLRLHAAFDRSWDALPEAERRAFRRLSVFQDGFRESAAAVVAGASPSLLVALKDRSLLQQREDRLDQDGDPEALQAVQDEIENVRAAWEWAVSQKRKAALHAALPRLFAFYETRGWFQEGEEAFGRAT